ncbi:Imm63 family immunity protein [Paenibacillus alvei]|uniref:Immunity protein 63 domain-containing protein n=1 Tax=Paenibacillus alvei TaxID=44250 RepID=A0AAP6ZZY5_PAEAL|nr:Imm63 family immunity protein [Paenibacillus alvei]NOJ73039.1 hypothetical protein [Paenibacillus alvei]
MYSESELTNMIFRILRTTSIYNDIYANMVTQPFQLDYYGDLTPCVRIRENEYEIVIYERGVQMLSKKTKNVDDVIYWIVEEAIHTIAHVKLLHKYKADNVNTHLSYSKEIMNELRTMVDHAFQEMGGIYQEWHKAGRRKQLE